TYLISYYNLYFYPFPLRQFKNHQLSVLWGYPFIKLYLFTHNLSLFFIYLIMRKRRCTVDERFFVTFIHCFFIAFGVMMGGVILGSLGALITGGSPLHAMNRISQSLKIWAIVA